MPMKPKRPCSYPGCPKLVDGQYCEEHKKHVDKQYNKYGRDNFTKSFYKTPEWHEKDNYNLIRSAWNV